MKLKKTVRLVFMIVAAMILMTANVFAAASDSIDWFKQTITVRGIGFSPNENYPPIQARELAKRAAVADGYRQLAEVVKGVNVTGETTVENMMILSEKVTTRVTAVIKGAKVVSENVLDPNGYEVVMQMPLFGVRNSLAGGVFEKQSKKTPFPNPVPNVTPTTPAYDSTASVQQRIEIVVSGLTTVQSKSTSPILGYSFAYGFNPLSQADISAMNIDSPQIAIPPIPQITPPEVPQVIDTQIPQSPEVEVEKNNTIDEKAIGGYTGVIVDCRNLDLQPVMSPIIKNEEGQAIYGVENLDYDKIIEFGMATYSNGMENIERAGKNPLVVKATRVADFHSNPVLSVADANRVLLENKSEKFLDDTKVVFIQ